MRLGTWLWQTEAIRYTLLALLSGIALMPNGCPSLSQPPTVTEFSLDAGAATTTTGTVTLNNTATNSPTEYMASEAADFTGATWTAYATAPTFTLSAGNGDKTVYFKVRNAKGESNAITDTIAVAVPLDPEVTAFSLDNGAATSTTGTVTLDNTAINDPTEYLASEAADFTGATWTAYATAPTFVLSAGNGTKTVYFKTRNANGESSVATDDISVVRAPEVTAFSLDSDAATSTTGTVTLDNTAINDPTEYMASEAADFAGASWAAYAAAPTFTLSAGNGDKTVYFKTRNATGESNVMSDTITAALPVAPEVTAFSLDAGAASTTTGNVTLDNTTINDPTEYLVSEAADFAGATWTAYSASPAFALSAGNGSKTVYFKTRNAVGESNTLSDDITVARAPEVTAFSLDEGAATTTTGTVTLDNTAINDPTEYMASEAADFTGAAWTAYAAAPTFTLSLGNETKTVYFKVRNATGESGVMSDTIDKNLTTWQKNLGGLGNERGEDVITVADGYVIAGRTTSIGAGLNDMYLMKTDIEGNLLWEMGFGTVAEEYGHAVAQTTDGGYVLVGYSEAGPNGGDDVYVVKTDASGVFVWEAYFGGAGVDAGYCVAATADGGCVVGGVTASAGAGLNDMWLIKLDSLGAQEWQQTYGGTSDDVCNAVLATGDGGYAVAGTTASAGAGLNDMYLVKTDSAGVQQWQQTYGGTEDDDCYGLVATADGGYVLGGSTVEVVLTPSELYMVKTDSAGVVVWDNAYGSLGGDSGYCVAAADDGGFVIAGLTDTTGNDGVALKVDTDGVELWSKPFDNGGSETMYGITVADDGNFVVVGYTDLPGNEDVYLVKTDGVNP